MNYFSKLLIYIYIIITLILITTYYPFFLFFILAPELLYIYSLLITIYFPIHKYYVFKINNFYVNRENLLTLWLENSKLNAFNIVYFLLLLNKNYIIVFVLSFLIFIFSIPLKILILIFTVFKRESIWSFYKFYKQKYEFSKNLKIEIFSKNIYLNGKNYTVGTFIDYSIQKNPNLNYLNFKNYFKDSESLINDFEYQSNLKGSFIKFPLCKIKTQEGFLIPNPHYTRYEGDSSLHATLGIPKALFPSQTVTQSCKSLIVPDANNPAFIISNKSQIVENLGSYKYIHKHEFDAFKIEHSIFPLSSEEENEIKIKIAKLDEIKTKHLGDTFSEDPLFSVRVLYNQFNNTLSDTNKEEFFTDIIKKWESTK